jgi:hypothetical protein
MNKIITFLKNGKKPIILFIIVNIFVNVVSWCTNNFRLFIFNIDYIFPILFLGIAQKWKFIKLRWIITSVLLAIVIAVDLLTAFQQIYFTGPFVLIDMLPFARLWPWRWIFPGMVAVLMIALLLVHLTQPLRGKPYHTRYLSVFIIFLISCDLTPLPPTNVINIPANLNLTSSGFKTLGEPAFQHALSNLRGDPVKFNKWGTRTLYSEMLATQARPSKILSVSVESLGVPLAPARWNLLVRNIRKAMAPNYVLVEARTQPYMGATLSGETRELCGIHFNTVPFSDRDLRVFHACLPALLQKRGFTTSAWHGGDSWFYNRSNIYQQMGFEQTHFFGDMAPNVSRVCSYLFVAICDADLFKAAMGSFGQSEREFMHIMTIDTHLPISNSLVGCDPQSDRQQCLYQSMIEQTIDSLGSAVRNSPTQPDLILVTGDHAPPFINGRVRREFRPGAVPWLVFVKRPLK